ncbi:hypothetical protein [Kingella negevensis]|uniref:hypothetical protein n=1 Tax=Kingella negevensis TaxID=1522312 RepID=UPI0015C4F992|nr:hypothetical protein [Kingella negevensis]MDK4684364.1 hypothetical protein [Kingella negevensis]MDK4707607.1 hypothetical protein [Kingella negevensis]
MNASLTLGPGTSNVLGGKTNNKSNQSVDETITAKGSYAQAAADKKAAKTG